MRKGIILILFLLSFLTPLFGQDTVHYRRPLDLPMLLSSTFGELRPAHFHAGLDIKTQGKTGYKVYAIDDGYIYRIKVQRGGYGKAVYIKHPDGKISVYAHLDDFAGDLTTYVKRKQYEKRRFFVDLYLNENLFPVRRGQVIGYSGNTGGSMGPHLHFEIRQTEAEPINPMLLGFRVPDTIAPTPQQLYVYVLNDTSSVDGQHGTLAVPLIKREGNRYEFAAKEAYGQIGLGIRAFDRQNNTWNKNGLYRVSMYVNGIKTYETRMDRIHYGLNRRINLLIDYPAYVKQRIYIQKLWKHPLAKLPVFKQLVHHGILKVEDGKNYRVIIELADFEGNVSKLYLTLRGKSTPPQAAPAKEESGQTVHWNSSLTLRGEQTEVEIPKHAVYDTVRLQLEEYRNGFRIGSPEIPLNKRFRALFSLKNIRPDRKKYAYLARVHPRTGKKLFATAVKKRDSLVLNSYSFGTYFVDYDSIAPVITGLNIKPGQWISHYRYLRFRVSDAQTGIGNVQAYIDGKWILIDWDPKTGRCTYDFNDLPLEGSQHQLRIVVTDRTGNRREKKLTFFRKH